MHTPTPIVLLPHLQLIKNAKIAIVLSCPGKNEQEAGAPATGQTGKNLERLFGAIRSIMEDENFVRKQTTITNAWPQVEYEALTGRSEALNAEITQEQNLMRLFKEIEPSSIVIASSLKAHLAIRNLESKLHKHKIMLIPHLGMKGINQIAASGNSAEERMKRRFEILAEWIATHLEDPGISDFQKSMETINETKRAS
jgi:hypothetical protein